MQKKGNYQVGYLNLIEGQNLVLQACQSKQYFKIRIISKKGQENQRVYEADVNNHKEAEKLLQLFDNRQEILEFMKQGQNVKIDLEKCGLILLGRHPTKKKEIVELFKIELTELIEEDEEDPLDLMKKSTFLENQEIKQILKALLSKIEQVQKWKIDGQQFKRMVHKVEYIGNKMETLDMKSVDFFEKLELWQSKYGKEEYEKTVMIDKLRDQINRVGVKLFQLDQWKGQYEVNYRNQVQEDRNNLQMLQLFTKNLEAQINELKKLIGLKRPEIEQQIHHILPPVDAFNMIDTSARYYKHFRIKGQDIVKQSDFLFPTILVGLKHIQNNDTFGIRINRMGILQKIYPGVCVGIIDSRIKDKQYCEDNDNVIQFGCTGKLYEGNKLISSEKQGYSINDTIQVIVNLSQPCIQWFVNKKLKCSYRNQKLLKNREIEWRPYVFMRDKGDSISWVL